MNSITQINYRSEQGRLLMAALTLLSRLPGYDDKQPDEIVLEVNEHSLKMFDHLAPTDNTMIPFELKGSLDKFEDAFMPQLVHLGLEKEDAVTVLSSIWLFANFMNQQQQAGKTFTKGLEELINSFSKENGSNTPDYILAQYLNDCLEAWNRNVVRRDQHNGFGDIREEQMEDKNMEEALQQLPIDEPDDAELALEYAASDRERMKKEASDWWVGLNQDYKYNLLQKHFTEKNFVEGKFHVSEEDILAMYNIEGLSF